jgi:hypothetical protein
MSFIYPIILNPVTPNLHYCCSCNQISSVACKPPVQTTSSRLDAWKAYYQSLSPYSVLQNKAVETETATTLLKLNEVKKPAEEPKKPEETMTSLPKLKETKNNAEEQTKPKETEVKKNSNMKRKRGGIPGVKRGKYRCDCTNYFKLNGQGFDAYVCPTHKRLYLEVDGKRKTIRPPRNEMYRDLLKKETLSREECLNLWKSLPESCFILAELDKTMKKVIFDVI